MEVRDTKEQKQKEDALELAACTLILYVRPPKI